MAGAKRTEVLKVSLDALWEVITDYEGYADFVDGCESCKVLKRKGDVVTAEYTVNKIKRFSYTLEHKEKPKKHMSWKMTDGEFFKSNSGSWDLKDLGKDGVEVTYEIEVGMPLLVPKALINGLVSTGLPDMLAGFEKRAKAKQKKKKA